MGKISLRVSRSLAHTRAGQGPALLFCSPGAPHGVPLLGPAARGSGSLTACPPSPPGRGRQGRRHRRAFRARPSANPQHRPLPGTDRLPVRPAHAPRQPPEPGPRRRLRSKRARPTHSRPAPPHPSGLQPHACLRLRPYSRPRRAPTAGPPSGDKARRRRAAGWGRAAAASLGPAASRRAAACGHHLEQGDKGSASVLASRAPSLSNAAPAGRGAGLPSASMTGAPPRGQRVPSEPCGAWEACTRGVCAWL